MSETKTYGRKDNAIAACRKAGLDPDEFSFVQVEGGRWTWEAKNDAADEVAPKQIDKDTLVVMPGDACYLVAIDGGDYGMITADRATQMAQEIADTDRVTIEIRAFAVDGDIISTVTPAAEKVEEAVVVPAAIKPGFGVNAKGEVVPIPGYESTPQPTATVQWDASAIEPKQEKPEPAAPVDQPDSSPTPSFEETLAPIVVEGHRFMICVEGDSFPQSSPEAWALEFSRKLKRPVVLRDAETFEILRHVKPTSKTEARKAVKASKPAGERKARGESRMKKTAPEGMIAQMIELATRRDGVTRPELTDKVSSKNQPWTALLKSAADRWGYEFSSERPGKNTVYRLTKIEQAAAAE